MSTAQERLYEVYLGYQTAKVARPADLKTATTEAQVNAIMRNVDNLHAIYLKAVQATLDATGPMIDAAYLSAKTANADVTKARENGEELADIIRLTTHAANTLKSFIAVLR